MAVEDGDVRSCIASTVEPCELLLAAKDVLRSCCRRRMKRWNAQLAATSTANSTSVSDSDSEPAGQAPRSARARPPACGAGSFCASRIPLMIAPICAGRSARGMSALLRATPSSSRTKLSSVDSRCRLVRNIGQQRAQAHRHARRDPSDCIRRHSASRSGIVRPVGERGGTHRSSASIPPEAAFELGEDFLRRRALG